MTSSEPVRYTGVAKFLHWTIALIIIMMLTFGQGFESITTDEEMAFSLTGHSSLGLTVIGLILLRILWRLGHPSPALPDTVGEKQKAAAKTSHLALYGLMIFVPLTGLYTAAAHEIPVMSYGVFDLRQVIAFMGNDDFDGRRAIHEFGTWLLIGLLVVHISAAFLHQFVQKDGVIRRMLPGKSKG
ncbi:MAG: cytochrome b/b6 domain-containing protein [Parasphingorhabdus sp.]